jgi:hypothetical protein
MNPSSDDDSEEEEPKLLLFWKDQTMGQIVLHWKFSCVFGFSLMRVDALRNSVGE